MGAAPYSHPKFVFARCAIGSKDRTWFIAEDAGVSRMLQLNSGKWVQKSVKWNAAAVCGRTLPEMEVFLIGTEGDVLRGTSAGFFEEQIDPVQRRPERLGILRDARIVAGVPHVVGMAFQVYRRGASGWQSISETIIPKNAAKKGFNSIDGTSLDELLAVGFEGEIWSFDGKIWRELDSPTNVSLNRVRYAEGGHAFACGQAGTLIEIASGTCQPAAAPVKGHNLYGVASFCGRVYAASGTTIFILDDGKLEPIDLDVGEALTAGYLESDGQVLWSVGPHHIACTVDGKKWSVVRCGI